MKLSEKLASIDPESSQPAARPARPTAPRPAAPSDNATDDAEGAAAPAPPRPRLSDMATPEDPTVPRPKRASQSWEDSKRQVRDMVLADLGARLMGPRPSPEVLGKEVRASLDRTLAREEVRISPVERRKFVAEMLSDILGYGPLDGPLTDPTVTEIMCNAFDQIWVERSGVIEPTDLSFTDDAQYRQVIDKIVSGVGRRVDESSPMVDARLPDGSRVNAVVPPLALNGAVLTIRKFAEDPYTVADLINFGSLTMDLALFLEACVRGKLNVLVSGGTGTGKTTTLNVLSSFIPHKERIVTIEDAAELQLQQPHVVRLESRPANAEGNGEVRIRDLVRNALRMRPDRIVVGEVRGGEALDMLQAMNTGHAGSITTVHANTARDALARLETMVLMAGFELPVRAIREQIASAIDVIIQLERASDGTRRIISVEEIQGMEGEVILLQQIFRFVPQLSSDGRQVGEVEAAGLRPKFLDKLLSSGVDLPANVFQAPSRLREVRSRTREAPSVAELIARGTPGGPGVIALIIAAIGVGLGGALMTVSLLQRAKERDDDLAFILQLPFGERDVPVEAVTESRALLERGVSLATDGLERFNLMSRVQAELEKARMPLRPGEFVLIAAGSSAAFSVLTWFLTSQLLLGAIVAVAAPFLAWSVVRFKVAKRRKAFEAQLPEALSLIASSLQAGHTALRSVQAMVEESEPPLSEEFARVVAETALGDPLVDALERLSSRLEIEDLAWVVQAIRIQQTVGGKLADLLYTLSDFMRAREEIRREIKVLTAEGRMSAWVLGGLPVFVFFAVKTMSPEYLEPMLRAPGVFVLMAAGLSVAAGIGMIMKMVRIEI